MYTRSVATRLLGMPAAAEMKLCRHPQRFSYQAPGTLPSHGVGKISTDISRKSHIPLPVREIYPRDKTFLSSTDGHGLCEALYSHE